MMVEGVYLYLFVVKVYNIGEKMHTYHVISWGTFISLMSFLYLPLLNSLCDSACDSACDSVCDSVLTPSYFCSGFPIVMVGISLSVAAGKDGIQSYTNDK